MTANYLAENDMLQEAGAILRGETRKIATIEHLKALDELVRTAALLLERAPDSEVSLTDWLREAAKVSR